VTAGKGSLDDQLLDWSTIKDDYSHALLIGNGASINVWAKFLYPSLFDIAKLKAKDKELFEVLDTHDFERALEALRVAKLVCAQEKHSTVSVTARYQRIRRALVEAVAARHVRWNQVPPDVDRVINRTLRTYKYVFSTNYDLLVYWAIMDDKKNLVDFFWGGGMTVCYFDRANVEVWNDKATRVLYLHGGLHLYRHADGSTRKRTAQGKNLLKRFAEAGDVPVFVSEGSPDEKLAVIRRNDYLSFALDTLDDECESLVVFGHRLSDADGHIRRRIAQSCDRLAISILPSTPQDKIIERKAWLHQQFSKVKTIEFFNAESHPLGEPGLHVGP
jgi:hypothetical protein